MNRIDTTGATAENQFTVGNPLGGEPATVLGAEYMNDFQEEFMGVLEAAGVVPTKGLQTQLLQSVLALVANSVNTALGREIDVVAPADLTAGDLYFVEELFGIAKGSESAGQVTTMIRMGTWPITKTTPQAWLLGEAVYWDTLNAEATTDGATGTRKRIGFAAAIAASGDATASVLLTGESVPTVVN